MTAKELGAMPAYPTHDGKDGVGMTIRAVTAIAAMRGLLANRPWNDGYHRAAETALRYADSLIEALAKDAG